MFTLTAPNLGVFKGSGAFGKVYEATWKDERVAVKVVNTTISGYTQVLQELHALTYIPCEFNVCKVFGSYLHDEDSIGIIMELCDFDLFDYISKTGPLAELQAKPIFRDVANSLNFMHVNGLYHCDIKLDNIMIKDGVVKIVDFGLMNSSQSAGSMNYAPPETWTKGKPGSHTDVWSLAICVYACLTNGFPWEIAHTTDIRYTTIISKNVSTVEAIFLYYKRSCSFSLELIDLLNNMMITSPNRRISMEQVYNSSWLVEK